MMRKVYRTVCEATCGLSYRIHRSSMLATPLLISGVCAILWLAWRLVKFSTRKPALENVRGPKADSWITGTFTQKDSPHGHED